MRVIVSHTHLDHWDGGEHQLVPKSMPLIVQNEADAKIIRAQGFTDVRVYRVRAPFSKACA